MVDMKQTWVGHFDRQWMLRCKVVDNLFCDTSTYILPYWADSSNSIEMESVIARNVVLFIVAAVGLICCHRYVGVPNDDAISLPK